MAPTLEIDDLLAGAKARDAEEADLLLDIRETLLNRGHPGKCVNCFFSLVGRKRERNHLAPLRIWLEENVEIAVSRDEEVLEAIPVRLEGERSLNEFCHRAMEMVREDRAYGGEELRLRFRYREAVAA